MSKIALSGNASGTGTLTIAAPNTNSDRTLSLPDAAGEMYNQGNILGTVSESSGVPTGAIIERGSNANGEYVKYADGTMICTAFIGNVTVSVAATSQEVFVYPFAATFTVEPIFLVSGQATNASGNIRVATITGALGPSNQTTEGRVLVTNNSASTVENMRRLSFSVVGRWY